MATVDDVARFALAMPEITEEDRHGNRTWCVSGEKQALLASNPVAFFTLPHFDGYAAVLIQLQKVTMKALRDPILDGWLSCATPTLAG